MDIVYFSVYMCRLYHVILPKYFTKLVYKEHTGQCVLFMLDAFTLSYPELTEFVRVRDLGTELNIICVVLLYRISSVEFVECFGELYLRMPEKPRE